MIQTVNGQVEALPSDVWLSHEHILVDFIGADSIKYSKWDEDQVIKIMRPFLDSLHPYKVSFFVDATPDYLGRDVNLLKKISQLTGIHILTNTGFYGAREDIFIPSTVPGLGAENIANIWIDEWKNGIDGTKIKPGFIKIGVDDRDTLDPIDQMLIEAAAITHQETGLTIASHTGKAKNMWPQITILEKRGIPLSSFIWVHAQNEEDNNQYVRAAEKGIWISLDGIGWEVQNHAKKLVFARDQGILDHILISHDAGWYDPQKETQEINKYTNIFTKLRPLLNKEGFTSVEWELLLSKNPIKAFAVRG